MDKNGNKYEFILRRYLGSVFPDENGNSNESENENEKEHEELFFTFIGHFENKDSNKDDDDSLWMKRVEIEENFISSGVSELNVSEIVKKSGESSTPKEKFENVFCEKKKKNNKSDDEEMINMMMGNSPRPE